MDRQELRLELLRLTYRPGAPKAEENALLAAMEFEDYICAKTLAEAKAETEKEAQSSGDRKTQTSKKGRGKGLDNSVFG